MSDNAPLFAAQEPIFPRRVSGFFRRLKWWIMAITLGIYYLVPWIRWDRGPNLPDQAVLVDLGSRRFYFFWIEIWPHEFYFVAGLLIMAGLGLFLFTSALGRVWCGYTCPQTVWTDLFLLVERWIEGDRNARLRLWKEPWGLHKWRLRTTKWIVWLLIAVATGGAWVFYFADAPTLARDLFTLNAPSVAYITIAILTATTFVFGGFLREQVCIYMCPWPRIQGAMMDEGTLTVGYRDWRGEPRGRGGAKRAAVAEDVGGASQVRYGLGASKDVAAPRTSRSGETLGDCIDCMACVNVCPMGIDIREGQQMECITCALCIDACDEVMAKIGRPRGLIDYLALDDRPPVLPGEHAPVRPMGTDAPEGQGAETGVPAPTAAARADLDADETAVQGVDGAAAPAPNAAEAPFITAHSRDWTPKPLWKHVLRPRTLVYTAAWASIGFALIFALFIRPEIELTVAPVRNPTFVTLSDGSIRNTYDIRLRNKHGEARDFKMSLTAEGPLDITLEGAEGDTVAVPPDATMLQRVYVVANPGDPAAAQQRTEFRFWVEDTASGERAYRDTIFNGKESDDELSGNAG